jgi:hypothetical protein
MGIQEIISRQKVNFYHLRPGMPIEKGTETLADYLMSKPVRYVAYSYAQEAEYPISIYGYRLLPTTAPWARREATGQRTGFWNTKLNFSEVPYRFNKLH